MSEPLIQTWIEYKEAEKAGKRFGGGIMLSSVFAYMAAFSADKLLSGNTDLLQSVYETVQRLPTDTTHMAGAALAAIGVASGLMVYLAGAQAGRRGARLDWTL